MARAAFVAAAVALGLQLLSLVGGVGGWWSPASGGAQAPHSTGFSHCRAQAPGARVSVTGALRLQSTDSKAVVQGLVAPLQVGSS